MARLVANINHTQYIYIYVREVDLRNEKYLTYLHFFAIDIQGADTEIYPNRVLLLLYENARLKALNDAGLSHIRVPDQDDFEKEVKRVINLGPSGLHDVGKNTYTKKNTEAKC